MSGVFKISDDVDLCFSPDDDGWYFQRHRKREDGFSEFYNSRHEAMEKWETGRVKWEDEGSD